MLKNYEFNEEIGEENKYLDERDAIKMKIRTMEYLKYNFRNFHSRNHLIIPFPRDCLRSRVNGNNLHINF